MKEHPILFSTPMVRAILEGRKTQTRRIVKPQPDDSGLWNDDKYPRALDSDLTGWNGTVDETGESKQFKCPYGEPGDTLWVRETWRKNDSTGWPYEYRATAEMDGTPLDVTWNPSIFMPLVACRIFLKVEDVRVERLQFITETDAKAEGVELQTQLFHGNHKWKNYRPGTDPKEGFSSPYSSFETLWREINGNESWALNPWVWVIKFSRI